MLMSHFMFLINVKRPEEDVHTYVRVRWLHITLRANMHSRPRRRTFVALALLVMSTHTPACELQVRNPQETRRYMIVSPSDIRNVSNPVIIGEYDCSESNNSQMC